MADHVLCVSVRAKNGSGRVENLINPQIGRFDNKLTLEDICIELIKLSWKNTLVHIGEQVQVLLYWFKFVSHSHLYLEEINCLL